MQMNFPPPKRHVPRMRSDEMQTYKIVAPPSTHWRKATCAEVDCYAYLNGWQSRLNTAIERQASIAYYIRKNSGRSFTEVQMDATTVVFKFTPGQKCFEADSHRVQIRQELFIVKGGDWRGNPRQTVRRHTRPQFWVEDFAENQQAVADIIQKG